MRRIALASLVALAGCTVAQVNRVIADGQVVCAIGPANAVAMVDPTGAPILARGATAGYVAAVCAAINAYPVPPPAPALPTVAVTPPPAPILRG